MKAQKKSWLMKFSLLSISLVLTSNTAIASALPLMLGFFKNIPQSTVELSMTIPQATVVIFIALSSFIAKKIGQKKTVFIGLILALISGVIPVFTSNFIIIMLSRIGLGADFGLFNSLAVSMITEFFKGEEAATLIGFRSAFQRLGSAIMTFVAGKLLNSGWQNTFWVYLIMLPIIFLFMSFVPEPNMNDNHEKITDTGEDHGKEKLKSSTNIGNFISPYGQKILEFIGSKEDVLKNIFLNSCVLMTILGIVFLVIMLNGKKRTNNQIIEEN